MLSPDYYYDSVHAIPYNDLWQRGIRALIFDLDNTLAPYDVPRPAAKIVALMRRLQRIGFSVCILTNNNEKRLKDFNEHLGVAAIHSALKPLPMGVARAMEAMNAAREQTAIIGDQLFSDIWAGRNARVTTIMVKPMSDKDIVGVRWKRLPERWFLNAYFKKQKNK